MCLTACQREVDVDFASLFKLDIAAFAASIPFYINVVSLAGLVALQDYAGLSWSKTEQVRTGQACSCWV
jgi:hypothetical protein